jgi:hypothetical protein
MFLSGPVLELSLLSVLTKFVIENMPEKDMEFIEIHGDFKSCGYGFFVIHGLAPCGALYEFSGSDLNMIGQYLP